MITLNLQVSIDPESILQDLVDAGMEPDQLAEFIIDDAEWFLGHLSEKNLLKMKGFLGVKE